MDYETKLFAYISSEIGNGGGIEIYTIDSFKMKNSELLTEAFNTGGDIIVDSYLVLIDGNSVVTKVTGLEILEEKGLRF